MPSRCLGCLHSRMTLPMQLHMPKLQSPLDPYMPFIAYHLDPCFAIDIAMPASSLQAACRQHCTVS